MIPLGMYGGAAADYGDEYGADLGIPPVRRRRPDGLDPRTLSSADLPGIATDQPNPMAMPAPGALRSYDPADVTNPNHPFHSLGIGVDARKEEVFRKQMLDAQANQPNPMTMPLSSFGADRYPLPRQVPAAPSALGILGPAIFGALGKMFGTQGGDGGVKGSSYGGDDDGPQYGGLY